MSNQRHELYEGMYIISPRLSDEARKKSFEKIVQGITGRGGEVRQIHEQGRRRLAYEICGHREGYYYLVYFTLSTASIKQLWEEYKISEELIRFMTMRTDKVLEKLEFKSLAE